ncbi:unnamed protein product (macronuclear) [Paramecium tetraurelia]|uniref:CCR4-NOT transcription complex subunit 11 n=1 Tax=Paramecium tetraurelia TaxID=5888 RepID=A0BMC6_PARTE|nr:uncharacterized protein GSPATT00030329001 [Paramecium tetraurelia]CAK59693.1 unnamed protein product [Paramecium tetraurelia]|eukprot:XP_001427091.1 hypothetical protein (macronuclear) [Paramecium tetraurelia strain d4-2]
MDKIKSLNIDIAQYQTDYLRPIPNIVTSDTLWNDNILLMNVQWNYTLEINYDKLSQVKEIIQKTCTTEISDEEQRVNAINTFKQLLFDYLSSEKELLKNCGFTCQRLPIIIEKNKEIAHFLLIQICNLDGFEEFLEVFIQTDVTQNTLELFAQLFGELKLPQEYITQYINYCIDFCNNIKEKQQQNKLVRFVSVFIQQMLKQKAFITKDILTDVRINNIQLLAFCIEFSKVGEVSKLFKLVKGQEPASQ